MRSARADDVLDATERVVGGIEVIDSRYEAFKFTLPDVIADNTSAARVAIGDVGVAPREVDLRDVECTFTVDGEVTGRATGAALARVAGGVRGVAGSPSRPHAAAGCTPGGW